MGYFLLPLGSVVSKEVRLDQEYFLAYVKKKSKKSA